MRNAIDKMEDMSWCPIPSCGSIAVVELDENVGRCQHCELRFCLDCKEHAHPFKRCPINRIDLMEKFADQMVEIQENNAVMEQRLNEIYLKHCTKRCPNVKCGVRITLVESSGCTQVRCTKCNQQFCWACSTPAKGQKHYKENPGHW